MQDGTGEGGLSAVAFESITSTLHEATRLTWWLHDAALQPLLGPGSQGSRAEGSGMNGQ